MTHHPMDVIEQTATEILAVCPECGRRVVVGLGKFVVIDQGDFFARHTFATGDAIESLQVQVG